MENYGIVRTIINYTEEQKRREEREKILEMIKSQMENGLMTGEELSSALNSINPAGELIAKQSQNSKNTGGNFFGDMLRSGLGIGKGGISGMMGRSAMGGIGGSAMGGGGMCCFVFLATDPDDELLEYVRRYKDSHYEIDSSVAHGYKRFAVWLVPYMKRYKIVKNLIKMIMVHPMELYAKGHYEERMLLKMVLSPIAHFWTFVYSVVGNFYGLKEWIQYWKLVDKW